VFRPGRCSWQGTLPIRPDRFSHERQHAVLGALLRDTGEARANVSWRAMEPKVADREPVDGFSCVRKRFRRLVPGGRVGERDAVTREQRRRCAYSAHGKKQRQHRHGECGNPQSHNSDTEHERSQVPRSAAGECFAVMGDGAGLDLVDHVGNTLRHTLDVKPLLCEYLAHDRTQDRCSQPTARPGLGP
jgi:hypothetical protein